MPDPFFSDSSDSDYLSGNNYLTVSFVYILQIILFHFLCVVILYCNDCPHVLGYSSTDDEYIPGMELDSDSG